MKQKINFLLITMLFALCLSACGKQSADQADAAVESGMQSQPEAVYRYVADDNGTKPANEGPRISINILDDVVMLVSITYE